MRKPFDSPHQALLRLHTPDPRLLLADLVRHLGRLPNWRIDEEHTIAEIQELVTATLTTALKEPHLLFGKRIEAVFPYVVAQLGRVDLITEEGAGEHWTAQPLEPADWRIVLRDRRTFLVEVKNCHHKAFAWTNEFRITRQVFDRLVQYSAIVSSPLLFAVYWTSAVRWTLFPVEAMSLSSTHAAISYETAQLSDLMAELGDFMVELPGPLTVTLQLDKSGEHGTKTFLAGSTHLGEAGAALVEAIISNSFVTVDEDEILLNERPATRFTIRTRIHGESSVVTEPMSALISYAALGLDAPRNSLPSVLHAPTDENRIVDLVAAAEDEGVPLKQVVLQPEPLGQQSTRDRDRG